MVKVRILNKTSTVLLSSTTIKEQFLNVKLQRNAARLELARRSKNLTCRKKHHPPYLHFHDIPARIKRALLLIGRRFYSLLLIGIADACLLRKLKVAFVRFHFYLPIHLKRIRVYFDVIADSSEITMLKIDFDIDWFTTYLAFIFGVLLVVYLFWDINYYIRTFVTIAYGRLFLRKLRPDETDVIYGKCLKFVGYLPKS